MFSCVSGALSSALGSTMANLDPDSRLSTNQPRSSNNISSTITCSRWGTIPTRCGSVLDAAARTLLAAASQHAALRLTEMESRAHYVRELHDGRR